MAGLPGVGNHVVSTGQGAVVAVDVRPDVPPAKTLFRATHEYTKTAWSEPLRRLVVAEGIDKRGRVLTVGLDGKSEALIDDWAVRGYVADVTCAVDFPSALVHSVAPTDTWYVDLERGGPPVPLGLGPFVRVPPAGGTHALVRSSAEAAVVDSADGCAHLRGDTPARRCGG